MHPKPFHRPDNRRRLICLMTALVPCLCNAAAIVVALAYPISGPIHQEIRQAVARRLAGNPVTDPLDPDQRLPGL